MRLRHAPKRSPSQSACDRRAGPRCPSRTAPPSSAELPPSRRLWRSTDDTCAVGDSPGAQGGLDR
eukprot:5889702-Prymnesium_polylepis.1